MYETIHNLASLDEAENAFFSEQLRQVRSKIFEVQYPELKARKLIPIDNEIDPGTETVVYRQFDHIGTSQIVSSYADDLPMVEIDGKEYTSRVKSHGIGYQYSIQEVKRAAKAQIPLDARKAQAARKGFEFTIDAIGAFGDAKHGLLGLLNQPNALEYLVPAGVAGKTTFEDKTADEMLKDLNGVVLWIIDQTHGVESPDTMILPPTQLGIIATTRVPMTETTVLDFFLKTNGHVRNVEAWYKCVGAGENGSDRLVAYKRDPEKLQYIIPQEFEQLPPQPVNLSFRVPCHGRIGGVVCYYPLSICYADGI